MKFKKINIKKLISLFTILFVFLTLSSFTNGNVSVKHNGKASASIYYVSSQEYASFKKEIKERINQHNISSGYSDAITIQSIENAEDGYMVNYKFRRIDKVVLNGNINLDKFNNFTKQDSETYYSLIKFNKGDVSCNVPAYFDNVLGKIVISRDTRFNVSPYDEKGNAIDVDDLILKGNNSKDNSMMLMFRLFNFENVKKVTIKLPGKIKYYGGNSIKLINENTFEITPSSIKAKITKNKIVIEDGVEKYEPVVETKIINSFIGYIVYDKSISPVKITFISILSFLGLSLVIFIVIYIYKVGAKEIKKQEEVLNECNK